mmetsp:Transcript_2546/g.6362  ORF Transcript_2546/g.6362 Transcript_2546/m.6362 type:complete len:206 (+) Transcript_2546:477-1094(+)
MSLGHRCHFFLQFSYSRPCVLRHALAALLFQLLVSDLGSIVFLVVSAVVFVSAVVAVVSSIVVGDDDGVIVPPFRVVTLPQRTRPARALLLQPPMPIGHHPREPRLQLLDPHFAATELERQLCIRVPRLANFPRGRRRSQHLLLVIVASFPTIQQPPTEVFQRPYLLLPRPQLPLEGFGQLRLPMHGPRERPHRVLLRGLAGEVE